MSIANGKPDKARDVAKYQRAVIFSLLANVILVVFAVLRMNGAIRVPLSVVPFIQVAAIVVTLFVMWSAFMLAKQFTNVVVAGLIALLMLVPLVSILLLAVYNQKAITYLQEHGIKVGFFGVSPSKVA